ncbi:Semaphorin-1A [Folsomia candida]|uniref:Semaphorin-1A n=1 Tax=Folsomia candida TaxID=158441 RepID=A0A226F2C5_FOLCA|nr:Semaphorin-1A [Folsomia candida]
MFILICAEPDDTITFSGNGSFTDFFKIVVQDGKNILVGARNAVYNLTQAGLKLNHKLEWYSEEDDIQMCLTKGKEPENCQNYIRVLSVTGPGKILVCGTNAYKPRCRYYHLSANGHYTQLGAEKTGQGICPYDPRHNSTSAYVDGEVYAGTVADFTEVDPLIHRWDSLRTTQYDLKYLNSPNFVGSMQYEDFVFFYFRETSQESTNCGKAVFSRVGRVCKGDRGFPRARGSAKNRWTTFFKARLNCSIPGEFPFYFDEIQSTSSLLPSSQLGNEVVYAVFTTGVNSITGSAVCAFKMRDLLDVFDGRFKAQEKPNMHWLPVEQEKVPEPRPGLCVNDSTTLPDQYYLFVSAHTLMDEPVQPLLGRPVLTRAFEPSRLTTIAVHTNATTPDGQAYDVLFIGTDDGKILTVINVGRGEGQEPVRTVMIQEMQIFKTPVREMLFLGGSPPKLLASSDHNLKLINVRQCFTSKIKSCSDCVSLQSPYCAWHKRESKCVTIPLDRPISRRDYIQNVLSTGNHSDCPKFSSMSSNAIPSEQLHKSTSKSLDSSGSQTITILSDDGQQTKEVIHLIAHRYHSVVSHHQEESHAYLITNVEQSCAKRCRKEDNIPYPDTDYEYFEQRHNLNINTRLVGEGKEEATYAEPVLDGKNNSNLNNMMPQVNHHQPDHQETTTMFHFAQPYARDLYRFEGDLNSRGRPDPFGSLRPGGMHLDGGYGTHRQPNNLGPKPNIPDGYGTAR